MLPKIAVLLDGSALAEEALPAALKLANLCQAHLLLLSNLPHSRRLTLISVCSQTDPPKLENLAEYAYAVEQSQLQPGGDSVFYPQVFTLYEEDKTAPEVKVYLEQLRELLSQPTYPDHLPAEQIETGINPGRASEVVEAVAQEEKVCLVVLAVSTLLRSKNPLQLTHIYQLLSHTDVPFLLVGANPRWATLSLKQLLAKPTVFSGGSHQQRLIVVLDGSEQAEAVLPTAIRLAAQLNATIYLLRVIVPIFGATDLETAAAQEQAYIYLNQLQERLAPQLPPNVFMVKAVRVSIDLAEGISQFVAVVKPGIVAAALVPQHRLGRRSGKISLKQLFGVINGLVDPAPALLVINAAAGSDPNRQAALTVQPERVKPDLGSPAVAGKDAANST